METQNSAIQKSTLVKAIEKKMHEKFGKILKRLDALNQGFEYLALVNENGKGREKSENAFEKKGVRAYGPEKP